MSDSSYQTSTYNSEEGKLEHEISEIFIHNRFISNKLRFSDDGKLYKELPYLRQLLDINVNIVLFNFITLLEAFLHEGVKILKFDINSIQVMHQEYSIEYIVIPKNCQLKYVQVPDQEKTMRYLKMIIECINCQLLEEVAHKKLSFDDISKGTIIDHKEFDCPNLTLRTHLIGEGGFGEIYSNTLKGIPIAIKFLKAGASSKRLKGFSNEFEILNQLNHENIIKVYGFTKYFDNIGIVMELCNKDAMNTIIRNRKKITFKEKINIVIKLSKAIEYMHMKNVCHFDIKPHNILFSGNFEPKLSDFGLSQYADNIISKNMGYTLIYSSPEQLIGKKMGKMADV